MPEFQFKDKWTMMRLAEMLGSDTYPEAVKVKLISQIPEQLKQKEVSLADHLQAMGTEIPLDDDPDIPAATELMYCVAIPHPDTEVLAFDILTKALRPEMPGSIRKAAAAAFASSTMLLVLGMALLLSYRDDPEIGIEVRDLLYTFGKSRKLGDAHFITAQRVADSAIWFGQND